MRGTRAKISNQKWPRFAPKLAVHRPKYDVLDHIFILKTVPKLVHVCTYIVILKNSIKTGTCNSLDYQKWPRFAPKLAVHRPKFWGKIARILVRRLLLRSGLRCKITVVNCMVNCGYFCTGTVMVHNFGRSRIRAQLAVNLGFSKFRELDLGHQTMIQKAAADP